MNQRETKSKIHWLEKSRSGEATRPKKAGGSTFGFHAQAVIALCCWLSGGVRCACAMCAAYSSRAFCQCCLIPSRPGNHSSERWPRPRETAQTICANVIDIESKHGRTPAEGKDNLRAYRFWWNGTPGLTSPIEISRQPLVSIPCFFGGLARKRAQTIAQGLLDAQATHQQQRIRPHIAANGCAA